MIDALKDEIAKLKEYIKILKSGVENNLREINKLKHDEAEYESDFVSYDSNEMYDSEEEYEDEEYEDSESEYEDSNISDSTNDVITNSANKKRMLNEITDHEESRSNESSNKKKKV